MGLSVVDVVSKLMVSLDLHHTVVLSVGNLGSETTGMVVEHGLRLGTSNEIVDTMLSCERHLLVLLDVLELSEVKKHCVLSEGKC